MAAATIDSHLLLGLPIAALATSLGSPTISNFRVTPSKHSSAAGDAYFSAQVSGASSCTLSSSTQTITSSPHQVTVVAGSKTTENFIVPVG
jgi:hypothetical protein